MKCEAAEKVKRTLEAKLALGDLSFLKPDQPATFAKYVENWEKEYVDLKASTATRYKDC
jgi:hypothetical protein